ncbi:MAG: hypothetical protein AAFX93_18550 [Verrucomicrobiota bacterium]
MSGGGKGGGGGGGQPIGHDYFASFAGVFGIGEASELLEIIVDSQSVWKPENPVTKESSSNPYQFSIPLRTPTAYWYWGTDDQVLTDPVLTKPGRDHPAYRHRPLLVLENFYNGFERLSVADIKVVYRRKADQAIVTASVADLDDGQCNPIAALAEAFTSEVAGAGLPPELLDQASWQAIAEELELAKDTEYLSPQLNSRMTVKNYIEEINGYADTWFRIGDMGTVEAGRFLRGTGEPAGLPVITQHDLTSRPTWEPNTEIDVSSGYEMSFEDRALAYEENWISPPYLSRHDSAETREATKADRAWITRAWPQAAAKVSEFYDRESTPYDEQTLSIREEVLAAKGLREGSNFIFEYEPWNYRAVMRITETSGFSDTGSAVSCKVESERLIAPILAAAEPDDPSSVEDEELENMNYIHLLQAPSELTGGEPYHVIALLGKEQGSLIYARLWFRFFGSAVFTQLGRVLNFAVPVRLAAEYLDSESLDDESGNLLIGEYSSNEPIGFDDIPGTQTDEEIADDNLLLFIIDENDTKNFEILTVKSLESPIAGETPVHVLRARFGTSRLTHAEGSPAYLINRHSIPLFFRRGFEVIAGRPTVTGRTITYRAALVAARDQLPFNEAIDHELELAVDDSGVIPITPENTY